MAKRSEIVIRRDDEMTAIDDALDQAITQLDDVNHRVSDLLQTCAPAPAQTGPETEPAALEAPDENAATESAEVASA